MKILSLFDGISCGQLALERAGIKIDKYFASEIDKFAIQIAQKNFSNTIQIGDVSKIKGEDYKNIDLIIGGSPCQGFSFAGKQLNFSDERSKLFFEYVRILKEVKPKFFLLENVKMKKEYQDIISENLFGIQSIEINSSLVSAQNRKRLYWIGKLQEDGTYKRIEIDQPEDKGISLKDIIEMGYYNGEKCINSLNRIIIKEKVKVRKYPVNIILLKKILKEHKKITIKEISEKIGQPKTLIEHWFRQDNSFSIPLADNWLQLKYLIGIKTDEFDKSILQFEIRDGKFDMSNRIYKINGKAPTLTTITGGKQKKIIDDNEQIRELTPIECERLQTIPDNYTEGVSNSQRYKMLGNGWTVDVISYIFSHLK